MLLALAARWRGVVPPGWGKAATEKKTSPHIKSSVLHVIIYHYIMYIIISLYTYNIGLPVYDPCFEYFVPLLHRASFSNNKAIQSTCPSSAAMCKALTSKRSLAFTLAVKEKGEFLFYSLTTRLLSELIKAFLYYRWSMTKNCCIWPYML